MGTRCSAVPGGFLSGLDGYRSRRRPIFDAGWGLRSRFLPSGVCGSCLRLSRSRGEPGVLRGDISPPEPWRCIHRALALHPRGYLRLLRLQRREAPRWGGSGSSGAFPLHLPVPVQPGRH